MAQALHPDSKIHPVFHVSLLERHTADTIPGRVQPPPPPLTVAGEDEFEVEHVLDSRMSRGKLQYHVHWKGYPIADRTWEPAEFLENAAELVQDFHREHPEKPGPLPRGAQP